MSMVTDFVAYHENFDVDACGAYYDHGLGCVHACFCDHLRHSTEIGKESDCESGSRTC